MVLKIILKKMQKNFLKNIKRKRRKIKAIGLIDKV